MGAELQDGPAITVEEEGRLVVVTYYRESSDEEFAEYLRTMDDMIKRNLSTSRTWVVINDATRHFNATATQRKMQAAWMTRHEQTLRERTIGVAFAVDRAIVRAGLTAIFWLQPLPSPHYITKDASDARTWAQARLREADGALGQGAISPALDEAVGALDQAAAPTVETRLARLESLHARGVISEDELRARRGKILSEV